MEVAAVAMTAMETVVAMEVDRTGATLVVMVIIAVSLEFFKENNLHQTRLAKSIVCFLSIF